MAAAQADLEAQRRQNETLVRRIQELVATIEARRQRAREAELGHDELLDSVEHLVAERVPRMIPVPAGEEAATAARFEALLAAERDRLARAWEEKTSLLEQAVQVAEERAHHASADCMRLQVRMEQQAAQARELEQTLQALTAEKKKLSALLEAQRKEREELAAARDTWQEDYSQLQEELAHLEHEHRELMNTLEEQRIEMEIARIALEARQHETENRESSAAQLRTERDSARAALEATQAEHERLRGQHKNAQRRLETALAELDALRHEAATQVAAAHAQAGEVEKRLSATQEQYYHARHAGQDVARELRELERRFAETAEFVGKMSARLTSAAAPDPAAAEAAYLHALTRVEDGSEAGQLSLEMNHRATAGGAAPARPDAEGGTLSTYADAKFVPFKPAEHKIDRSI
jgi:chromosome segregation ATPase